MHHDPDFGRHRVYQPSVNEGYSPEFYRSVEARWAELMKPQAGAGRLPKAPNRCDSKKRAADKKRANLLAHLADWMTADDLAKVSGTSQQFTGYHLKEMRINGTVQRRRAGRKWEYIKTEMAE